MAGIGDSDACSKVELSVSCTDLMDLDRFSKSDPIVYLYERKGQEWIKLGRTEMIDDNLNPKFAKTFTVDYRFEEVQQLSFACYDIDNRKNLDDPTKQEMIGTMECLLADIVTAGKAYQRKLRHRGKPRGNIQISAEEIEDSKFEVTLQLKATKLDKKDFFGKSDPFLEISKAQEGGNYTIVYRSEPVMKNLNPIWPAFTLSSQKLCSGDWDRTLRFSVWDWNRDGTHDYIGEATASLRDITPERGGQIAHLDLINNELKRKKKKYTNSGTISFRSVRTTPIHSFVDYIRGGCQISLIVAIDFTASNGKPSTPNSLHYINPYKDNEYMTAIKSVGSVLTPYDSDNQFPVFGFGAKFRHTGEVSHCFPLNFNPAGPEVTGVQGILDVYHYALNQVDLYGPTNFSSVLDATIGYASGGVSQANQQYYILLIITDGEITDMQNTVDRVVKASSLPLSIVIVGVGEADFSKMEVLDADENPLIDRTGRRMERDIVQFVPLRQFYTRSGANFSLARETLAEIPNQFLSYMKKANVKPNPPPLRKQQTTIREQYPSGPPAPFGAGGQPPQQYPGPQQQGYPSAPPYPSAPGGMGGTPYPTPGHQGMGGAPYPMATQGGSGASFPQNY